MVMAMMMTVDDDDDDDDDSDDDDDNDDEWRFAWCKLIQLRLLKVLGKNKNAFNRKGRQH